MSLKRVANRKTTPLVDSIEVEITSDSQKAFEMITSKTGIDPEVVEHLEELLEKMSLPDLGASPPPANANDITCVFKKIADIEKKLKAYEAESKALRALLMRLH